jgi:outer membrane receptor protein involved in Fe transport
MRRGPAAFGISVMKQVGGLDASVLSKDSNQSIRQALAADAAGVDVRAAEAGARPGAGEGQEEGNAVKHRGIKLVLLAGAFAAGGCGVAAAAPQQPEETGTTVGQIVVTAQNREQKVQDVPISMAVVGGDALKRQNIVSLSSLSTRLSDVNIIPSVSTDIIMVRGIGSGFNGGFEQAVATFVDGVYRSRARSVRAALFDVDRVEVLRGPQTTYFGNNAIAGAFNITTRKANPGDPVEWNASGLYSPSDGEYEADGAIGGSITDKLAGRVAIQLSGMNGYLYNGVTKQDEPHNRDMVGRVSLAYQPDDNFRSDFRVDLGHMNDRGVADNELIDCPPDVTLGIPAKGACAAYLASAGASADTSFNYRGDKASSFIRTDFAEAGWTNKFQAGAGTLTSISTFYWHQYQYNYNLVPVSVLSPIGTSKWLDYTIQEKFKQLSQEFRWDSKVGDKVNYMVGAYILASTLDLANPAGYYFAPFGARVPGYTASTKVAALVDDTRDDVTISFFTSADVKLTPKLTLNLAARYSAVSKDGHRSLVAGQATAEPIGIHNFVPGTEAQQAAIAGLLGLMRTDFPNTHRTDKALMPSVGLQYRIDPETMLYAKYTRGAKAGGWSTGGTANEFTPEKVDAFEAGLKANVLNRRGFITLAAFLSKYKDLQEASNNTLPSGAVIAFVGNVARAEAKGVELGSTWRLTDQLTLDADLAYLISKYTSYPNASCNTIQSALKPVGCVQDLSGRTRPFAPKWSGQVSLHYATPLAGRELRIDPTVYFKSEYYTLSTLDPLALQHGFAKVDARISYGPADRRWEFAIIGKNLTDKATSLQYNSLISSPGSAYVMADRPRSVAFQISIRN